MATALAPHLSHKSALVLLPPAAITAPIQAVRRIHDKHFARWPPHINLVYPFLASPSDGQLATNGESSLARHLKGDIRSRIQRAVKEIQPFHMTLSAENPQLFVHGKKSKTMWLAPSSDTVKQLQAALQMEFAECDADRRPFVPHLSLGQVRTDAEEERMRIHVDEATMDHFSKLIVDELNWIVDTVYVIEREGYKTPFKIIDAINLGAS